METPTVHPQSLHPREELANMSWRERVAVWKHDHEALMEETERLRAELLAHEDQVESHLAMGFHEDQYPQTHDALHQTPEGRQLERWLQEVGAEAAEIRGLMRQMKARQMEIHRQVLEKVEMLANALDDA